MTKKIPITSLEPEDDFDIAFSPEELGVAGPDPGADVDLDLEEEFDVLSSDLAQPDESATPAVNGQEGTMNSNDSKLEPDTKNEAAAGTEDETTKNEVESTAVETSGESKSKSEAGGNGEEPSEEEAAAQAALRLEQFRTLLGLGISNILSQTPEIAQVLQLTHKGDSATVTAYSYETTFDVTLTVTHETGDPRNTDPYSIAPLLAASYSPSAIAAMEAAAAKEAAAVKAAIKCRFGNKCKNGAACAYDHSVTVKHKPCMFVNTAQGCNKAGGCEYSHESAGVKCARSETRRACKNGPRCVFKHADDEAGEEKTELPSGTKRGREEGEEDQGAAKRPRVDGESAPRHTRLHGEGEARRGGRGRSHGRGGRGGRGRGRGRGRGGGRGAGPRGQ
jgi:hypothetical protein